MVNGSWYVHPFKRYFRIATSRAKTAIAALQLNRRPRNAIQARSVLAFPRSERFSVFDSPSVASAIIARPIVIDKLFGRSPADSDHRCRLRLRGARASEGGTALRSAFHQRILRSLTAFSPLLGPVQADGESRWALR
jgi:hypothetical protein